jgi:hypothetical protein
LPVVTAKENDLMGCNIGAINIAPIITGILFVRSPNVAILLDKIISIQ